MFEFDPVFIVFSIVMILLFIYLLFFTKDQTEEMGFYYSQYQADNEDGIIRMDNGLHLMRESNMSTKYVYHEDKWHRYTFMSNVNDDIINKFPHLNLKLVCIYKDYTIAINKKSQSDSVQFDYKQVAY